MAVDFTAVAQAALAQAPTLLAEWIGGSAHGREWHGAKKANGGPGDSWKVNLETGQWGGFASGEKGGDLVSLYAALNHISQIEAAKRLSERVGVNGHLSAESRRQKPTEEPPEPIPPDAPPLEPHSRHGRESALYRYGDSFIVARYDTPDGKTFTPYTWRRGAWVGKGYSGIKPLYRIEDAHARPKATILVVEGEKCVEAARDALPQYVVLTWSGGAQSVARSDWSALAARDVIIWPDADEPGREGARAVVRALTGVANTARVADPTDAPEGWDIADAIADGWDTARLLAWIDKHIVTPSVLPAPQKSKPPVIERGELDDSALVSWQSLGLDTNQGGLPYPTLANASRILQLHPSIAGKIWYDTFQRRVWHTMKGEKREWEDADSADLAVFIQQSMHLSKFTVSLVADAVNHAARRKSRNSLTAWLDSLQWDGTERLDTWLGDILGVERTVYSMAVARNWPLSMVARAYQPGCQVDSMPVLEGAMGRGKSSFLKILGGEWYDSITTAIGEKDFIQEIQGVWLVEIPDMTGFGRREHSQVLATITIRNDRYRASYGRCVENHLRGCVFAATSETDDYLQDVRGRRRFWPVRCTAIDLDTLSGQREQIFAEAVALYKQGARWHEMPTEADDEQLERMQEDLWTDAVLGYVSSLSAQMHAEGKKVIAIPSHILHDVMKLELKEQTQTEKNRVAGILQRAGWLPGKHKGSRCWFKPIRKP